LKSLPRCIAGLVVDYSAHIAHAFVLSTGTSAERSVKALERMGPSVFNAIVSTMLAVIVLSTSETFIFQTFFRSLCLTVVRAVFDDVAAGVCLLFWGSFVTMKFLPGLHQASCHLLMRMRDHSS
jgi:hypothetical protein